VCGAQNWSPEYGRTPHPSKQPYRRGERLGFTAERAPERAAVFEHQLADGRLRIAYLRRGRPTFAIVDPALVSGRIKKDSADLALLAFLDEAASRREHRSGGVPQSHGPRGPQRATFWRGKSGRP
jgi:hypothetical protein